MSANAALVETQQQPSIKTKVVCSPASPLNDVVRACARIAPSEATVLVTGETGTGKEVFARLIHEKSARAGKAFVPVNCGAIPEALLESELFGHARGAFTGAVAARKGRLAMAEGGTLFLDEIGELPLTLQVKLLRVLQERTYEPVGSSQSVSANFRLVAATNRDLAAEVEAGRFRRDLYYRLMVCPIELPALRDRKNDIATLFLHFWTDRGEHRAIEPQVLAQLERYSWPGNVRELENLVERLSVCAEGASIRLADLPPALMHHDAARLDADKVEITKVTMIPAPTPPNLSIVHPDPSVTAEHFIPLPPPAPTPLAMSMPPPSVSMPLPFSSMPTPIPFPTAAGPMVAAADAPVQLDGPVDLAAMLRRIEDSYIDAALARANGNKKAAADLLGLQRTTLVEKLRRRTRDAAPVAGAVASEA